MSEKAKNDGWQIDLYSTILSRKNSLHRMEGKLRLVKPRPVPGRK